MVRAPPCHGGSCGFEPRLPRTLTERLGLFTVGLIFFSLASCSSPSFEDFREEGLGVTRAITSELRQIRSRDDLLLHTYQLQIQFSALVDLMIRAQEFKNQHPEAEIDSLDEKDRIAADELRIELNRILNMEGGREVIEKTQSQAFQKLKVMLTKNNSP